MAGSVTEKPDRTSITKQTILITDTSLKTQTTMQEAYFMQVERYNKRT